MTLKECIDIVDNIKPNQYSVKDKVLWLSFIDEIIINDVLKTHEGYDGRYDDFSGYSEDKLSVALIVPSPYDRLYTAYLKMKIDGENGETARYNNSAVLFNSYMLEYRKYYNKTHMPLNTAEKMVKPECAHKHTVGLTDAEYESLKRDLENSLSNFFADSVSPDKLYNAVYNYAQNNLEMLKGKDGETPIKGRDYFTEDEVNDIKADAKNQTIVDLRPEFSAINNKINGHSSDISRIEGKANNNSSDIKRIDSQVRNHNVFINAEMPEYLRELRNLVNNAPKDADGNIIESASKVSVDTMKALFPMDEEGNLKEIASNEVAVSDEFVQGRFASVGDEVYEVVSDDGDFSVNMTVALETSNDPHGSARIKLKIPEGKWDIYILSQDDTSSEVVLYINNILFNGSSNRFSHKFLREIMDKEDYFSNEVITLDLNMMELGGSCSLELYCAYLVDGKDGLMSSEDKAKLVSIEEKVDDISDTLEEESTAKEALKESVDNLSTKLIANTLKNSASGTIVSMKDVSPIEHEMGVKVRGNNSLDLTTVTVHKTTKNILDVDTFPMFGNYSDKYPSGWNFEKTDTGLRFIFSEAKEITSLRSGYQVIPIEAVRGKKLTFSCRRYSEANDTNTSTVAIIYAADNELNDGYIYMPSSLDNSKQYRDIKIATNGYITYTFTVPADETRKNLFILFYAGIGASIQGGGIIEYSDIQFEVNDVATKYEHGTKIDYKPTANGTVPGVISIHPSTTLYSDTAGVVIDVDYNRDINIAFKNLEDKITALSAAMI